MNYLLGISIAFFSVSSIASEKANVSFSPFPEKLSEWGLFHVSENTISLKEGVVPYSLKNPLFSDYASKFRTVMIPHGTKVSYRQNGILDFPVGSVISKTFGYKQSDLELPESEANPQALPLNIGLGNAKLLTGIYRLETRILVRQESAWVGIPYVWDSDQKDATIALIGQRKKVRVDLAEVGLKEFVYQVPNFNQCKACHVKYVEYAKIIKPIGPRAINLNHDFEYDGGKVNQLEYWDTHGILTGLIDRAKRPSMEAWDDENAETEARARSYLFANCAHCHGPSGPASTSGLYLGLSISNPIEFGVCKTPVAVGNGGSGGMAYDIVPGDAEHSILYHRLKSEDPAVMMPELGRSIAHKQGVALIYQWISEMEGECSASN